jgi:hypothetical protein
MTRNMAMDCVEAKKHLQIAQGPFIVLREGIAPAEEAELIYIPKLSASDTLSFIYFIAFGGRKA